jgi:methylase of polypeptide subunit release factors
VSNKHGEKTEFGPGKTALYYNNVGLFSDPFLEDRLPNLEKYYKHPSTRFLNDYWNVDESDATKYNNAFQNVMDLWNKLDQDVPKFCVKERQLQNSWIDKIFEYLGWTIELEETSSKNGVTNFPDYALFASVDDWKKSKSLTGNNKFKRALAVADAKDWGISLDGKGFSNKNPSFQIINYLKQTDKNWGILTDGKYWRIYSLRSDSKHSTYYEIDLEKILASGDYQRFKYFYNFFRSDAFVLDAKLGDRSFLDFVFEDGKFYSQTVEKNLNERVYKVVNSICQGFLANYSDPSDQDLKEVYENSMYYLFKLMFVLNCESKGLLEVNKQDDYYESSLRKKCLEIKEQKDQGKNWSSQPRSYNYILDLFDLLKKGDQKIGVHGFGNEPFEMGSSEFYSKNKIGDDYLNNALLELSCDVDNEGGLQVIDYKILSPDHIGSLFEGLLEFNLIKEGKKVDLVNTKGDRKSTGSYYTPDYLVDYIVEETLTSLVLNKDPSEILKLRVLDPAMGSGHFLLGVVKYLENTIIQIQNTDSKVKGSIEFDKVRQKILKNCVFGVDINPLATQLAKFSLWIYTSNKGDYIEPLKDQFVTNNTLSDHMNWEKEFEHQIKIGEIDAIVGNPPYIGEKGNKEIFHAIKEHSIGKRFYQGKMDYFYFFFHKTLDLLKQNGIASLVSTNYFITASGAPNLRADLKDRATLLKIINFNELKIFKGAQGQHNQVTFFKKGRDSKADCECYAATLKGACNLEVLNSVLERKNRILINNEKIYYGKDNQILIGVVEGNKLLDGILRKMKAGNTVLSEIANVNTGADVTISEIKKSHMKKFKGDFKENDGVFVLNKEACLSIPKSEHDRLKTFIKCSDITSYEMKAPNDKKLIYFTWTDSIAKHPKIENHLKKFKKILDDQMERYGEDYPWYALHRPRDPEIFESENKLVVPYRTKLNIFSHCPVPAYSSRDVLFILPNQKIGAKELSVLFNSKTYYTWLYHRGKRKGDTLELYQTPLSELPIPAMTETQIKSLRNLFDEIKKTNKSIKALENAEKTIYLIFEFSSSEIEYIEKFYDKKGAA